MRVVRFIAALVASAGLLVAAGCGGSSDSGSNGGGSNGGGSGVGTTGTAPAVPTDPKAQLVAGIKAVNKVPHRMKVTSGAGGTVASNGEGAVDPGRRAARFTQSTTGGGTSTTIETVVLGTDVYLRADTASLPGLPAGRWAHLDGGKLRSLRALGLGSVEDPSGNLAMVDAIVTVERVGPAELRGTMDATKGSAIAPNATGALGDTLRNLPWRARFDGPGRLVWLSLSIASGGTGGGTIETEYSAFGDPVTVDRPPARDTIDAPAGLYKLFGG
jgi:hypothetical protein